MRLRQLDSLRGIAAVTVVAHHYVWTRIDTQRHLPHLPRAFWLSFQGLHPLFAGHEAVLFFFVLSGIVLSGAIVRREKLAYPGYVLHRVCRIYLPYLAALLLAIVACAFFRTRVPGWTDWTLHLWPEAPGERNVLQHVLFIGVYPERFNTVFWTIIVEMRVSLILPFLVLLLQRLGMRLAFLFVGVWAALDIVLMPLVLQHIAEPTQSLFTTLHWTIAFAAGILIELYGESLGRWYVRLGLGARATILAVSFVMMDYLQALVGNRFAHLDLDIVGMLGAAGILFSAMHSRRFAGVLNRQPFWWLGKISFSLYLCHVPVILVLGALLGDRVWYPLLALMGFAISCAIAQLLVSSVEGPAQRLGRRLDKRYVALFAQPSPEFTLAATSRDSG